MTQTISAVKENLDDVLDNALDGKPTLVERRGRFVIIQACPSVEPIPDRPPGSFLNLYTAEEVARETRLAKDCIRQTEIE